MTKKKEYPLVTIAIPTYNRADSYLKQSLGSAVRQTYPEIEIIVSDNCSTDNTREVIESFNDPRIKYIRQDTNIGANGNMNYCVDQARGDYLLLLFDDDMIDDDFIDICIKAAECSTGFGVIKTGDRMIDSSGKIISQCENRLEGLSIEEVFITFFSQKVSFFLCSMLLNTKGLREIGGFRSRHNHWDDEFAEFQLMARFGRLDIADIKASYRVHPSTMTSRANSREWCEDSLFLLDSVCNMITSDESFIRKKGRAYFTSFNYRLARQIESPMQRILAYITVLRTFKYVNLQSPVYRILNRTPLYSPLRSIKRRLQKLLFTVFLTHKL